MLWFKYLLLAMISTISAKNNNLPHLLIYSVTKTNNILMIRISYTILRQVALAIIFTIITSLSSNLAKANSSFFIAISGGVESSARKNIPELNKLTGLVDLSVGYERSPMSRIGLSFRQYLQDFEIITETRTIFGQPQEMKYQIDNRLFFLDLYYELYQNNHIALFWNFGLGGYRGKNKNNITKAEQSDLWQIAGKAGAGIDYMFDSGFCLEAKYDYIFSTVLTKINNKFIFRKGHNFTFGVRYNL